jgi:hypothetical protein
MVCLEMPDSLKNIFWLVQNVLVSMLIKGQKKGGSYCPFHAKQKKRV